MNATSPLMVHPRAEGDPVVDLTMMSVLHRAMRADVRSLAALTAERGDAPFPAAREKALGRFLDALLAEIHSHHAKEDGVLWPVIAASAGAAVDLRPLTEDHGAIDPVVDRIRAGAGTARAAALAELRDLLDEHIAEEEAVVFPVMRRYVSVADFTRCEKSFRPPPNKTAFILPWIAGHAGDDRERLVREAGPVFRVLLRLLEPSYQRLRAAVFTG